MTTKKNRLKLMEHIVGLSISNDFALAKTEWEVERYEFSDNDDEYCPCGQHIHELCFIRNKYNNKTTYVGNVCINQFLEIETKSIFNCLRRIRKEPEKAIPNLPVIKYATKRGFVYANEPDFLLSICGKRKLTKRQRNWLNKINRRINLRIIKSKPL